MQRLTMKEVTEAHGGILPPDATLRADDEPHAARSKNAKRRTTRSERFAMLNAFTDFELSELTGTEVKVWLILFRDTKATTGTARTGQTDIARRAGVTPRAVRKAISGLIAKGFVQVVNRGRLNVGPSQYRLSATGNA